MMEFQISVAMITTTSVPIGHHADTVVFRLDIIRIANNTYFMVILQGGAAKIQEGAGRWNALQKLMYSH